MDKRRILQVAAVDGTLKGFLLPLIDALLEEGYEVEAACSVTGSGRQLVERGYVIHDIPFRRKMISIHHLTAAWKLFRLIKRRKYHVVHVHTAIAAVIARIVSTIARVPTVIYTAHGFYLKDNMNILARVAVVIVERILGTIATDWLFTVSRENAALARRYRFLASNRIIYIGNGVDLCKFGDGDSRKKYRKVLRISNKEKVIGFVGRLVEEKGIMDLLEAFKIVKKNYSNAKLLVVGDVSDSERDTQTKCILLELIVTYDLEDSVILTGYRDDIPGLLAAMDVFCLPSHREGMPMSILEAMASYLPVVATNISGSREAVLNGITGTLVEVGSPWVLAYALINMLSDEELAARLGHAGRERVVEYYDEKTVIDRQLELYERIFKSDHNRQE